MILYISLAVIIFIGFNFIYDYFPKTIAGLIGRIIFTIIIISSFWGTYINSNPNSDYWIPIIFTLIILLIFFQDIIFAYILFWRKKPKKSLLDDQMAQLENEYPLTLHTQRGLLFSTVRRMKAEKELGIPINRRAGSAVSTETGKHANEMIEQEWEKFYGDLSSQLKTDYPDMYADLFN